jgi:hypothetical protein
LAFPAGQAGIVARKGISLTNENGLVLSVLPMTESDPHQEPSPPAGIGVGETVCCSDGQLRGICGEVVEIRGNRVRIAVKGRVEFLVEVELKRVARVR